MANNSDELPPEHCSNCGEELEACSCELVKVGCWEDPAHDFELTIPKDEKDKYFKENNYCLHCGGLVGELIPKRDEPFKPNID